MKNAAIVGCGNIAGFLDGPADENILTHAHAYAKHADTQLIAVCDPSARQREKFISKWGETIRTYESLENLLENETIDILSICSPTPFHFEAMKKALQNEKIKTIICEKPFVYTRDELESLIPLIDNSSKQIVINFLRRYDPSIQKAHELITSKKLGEIRCFHAQFTKGLYHNGSHMLELIEHLCGDITSLSVNNISLKDDDLYGNFYLQTTSSTGVLQNFSGQDYALFELEITLSQGRVLIKDSGHCIQIETVRPSKKYEGYFSLEKTTTLEDTMSKNLLNTLDFALNATTEPLTRHLHLSKKLLDIKETLQNKHILTWEPL